MKIEKPQKTIAHCADKLYRAIKTEGIKNTCAKFDSYWLFFSELFPRKYQDEIVCNEELRDLAMAFYAAGASEGNEESFIQVCNQFKDKYPLVFSEGSKHAQ